MALPLRDDRGPVVHAMFDRRRIGSGVCNTSSSGVPNAVKKRICGHVREHGTCEK